MRWMMALAAAVVMVAAPAAAQTAWQTVRDNELGFSAELPGTAQVTRTPGATGGPLQTISYAVETDRSHFSVLVLEYGDQLVGRDPATILDGAVTGGIQAIKGQELSRTTVRVSGQEARDARFTADVDGTALVGRLRVTTTGDKVISVIVIELAPSDGVDAARAIASLKLLP